MGRTGSTAGFRIVSLAMNVPGPVACSKAASEGADVLVTSMRHAALARLGLDRHSIQASFPRLAHLAIVGHSAPDADLAGHDLTYQAAAGLLRPPALPISLLADLAGGERAFSGILELLLVRERAGTPGFREVSLADSARDLALPRALELTSPEGPLGGGDPFYRLYETAAGWVAVAALEPHFRNRLLVELECDASASSIESAFRGRTAPQWERWGREHDLPVVAVPP